MSLRRLSPRLLSGCRSRVGGAINPSRIGRVPANPLRRRLASSPSKPEKKMTAEELDEALHKANESMRAYYSYPPEKVIALKKANFNKRHRDNQFYLQVGMASTLLCAFLITPFLGRKIAYDEEFRKKYIPAWYDYTVERPQNAWTKEELQQEIMLLQRKLHERAIAGEFTPEKLEEMRRKLAKEPEEEEYAHFSQLHPGVDDDEELEDD